MSKVEKLKIKIQQRPVPKDFTYAQLRTLLGKLGFKEDKKRDGSRVHFVIPGRVESIIKIHKPHPGNEMSPADVEDVVEVLKSLDLL